MKSYIKGNRKYLFVTVVIWLLLWGLLISGQTKTQKYELKDSFDKVTVDRIDISEGYNISGNQFCTEGDVYYFEIKSDDVIINSLKVTLLEPYDESAIVKIYYSDIHGGFSELKTLEQGIQSGDTSITFNLPENNVQRVRVCIPNTFWLQHIELSNQKAILYPVSNSHIKWWPFLVFNTIVSLLLGAGWLKAFPYIRNLMDRMKKNWRVFGIRVLLLLGTILILCIVQFFFTGQFASVSSSGIRINYYRVLFTTAFSIFGWGVWWLRKEWGSAPEKLFVLVALTTGIMITITMPMLSERSWDAAIHYQNSVSLANAFEDEYHYMDVGHLIVSYNLNDVEELNAKYNQEYLTSGVVKQDYKLGDVYGHLGHLPAAIGIFLAEGLHMSLIMQIWMGRLFVLLFYAIIMYFAIKRIKVGKLIMALIGLYPTCVMLSANYTYDPWLISLVMLGMSYMVNMMISPEEHIKMKDCLGMLLALGLALGPKPVYFPIILLALFIPRAKFISKKERRWYYLIIVIVTIVVFASVVAPMLMSSSGVGGYADNRGGMDINPAAQLTFIFTNPLTYTKTLLKFLKYYWSLQNTANYMVLLGYLGMTKFHYVVLGVMIFVILTDATDGQIYKCSVMARGASLLMAFGTSCILATVFYLVYTGVGYDGIGGCQPRYLLPILFPAALALRNNKIDLKLRRDYYNIAVFMVAAFVVWYGVLQIIVRPYCVG